MWAFNVKYSCLIQSRMGCISLTSISRFEIYVFENICRSIFVYSTSPYNTFYERKVRQKIIISQRCVNSLLKLTHPLLRNSLPFHHDDCDLPILPKEGLEGTGESDWCEFVAGNDTTSTFGSPALRRTPSNAASISLPPPRPPPLPP